MKLPIQKAKSAFTSGVIRIIIVYSILMSLSIMAGIFYQEIIAAILMCGVIVLISVGDFKTVIGKYKRAISEHDRLLKRRENK